MSVRSQGCGEVGSSAQPSTSPPIAERRIVNFYWPAGAIETIHVNLIRGGVCDFTIFVKNGRGQVSATLRDAPPSYQITAEIFHKSDPSKNVIKTLVYRNHGNGISHDLVEMMQPKPESFLSTMKEKCVIAFNIYYVKARKRDSFFGAKYVDDKSPSKTTRRSFRRSTKK